jgi:hypothetical protein
MSDETEPGRRWREKFPARKHDLRLERRTASTARDAMTLEQLRADALQNGFVLDDSLADHPIV